MSIGIDLGAAFARVAGLNSQGAPFLYADANAVQHYSTPAVVLIDGSDALIGHAAELSAADAHQHAGARQFKSQLQSPEWAWKDAQSRRWSATALTALLLRKLLRDVATHEDSDPHSAVLAVPCHFSDGARRALKSAAAWAGLKHIQLIDEPLAAARFFGLDQSLVDQTVLLVDVGATGTQACVLQISKGRIDTLAAAQTPTGGNAYGRLLAQQIAPDFSRRHRRDLATDAALLNQLERAMDGLKAPLADAHAALVRRTLLVGDLALEVALNPLQVAKSAEPLVRQILDCTKLALSQCGLSAAFIDRVLLIGEASAMPGVLPALAAAFARPASEIKARQAANAVAFGAALAARDGAMEQQQMALSSVAALDLGIRVRSDSPIATQARLEPLIKRGTSLPAQHAATFYTTRPEQTRLMLDIVQGHAPDKIEASLGLFAFGPIRRPRKNYPIEVSLSYDREGLVKLTARDPQSGESINHAVHTAGNAGESNQAEAAACAALRLLV